MPLRWAGLTFDYLRQHRGGVGWWLGCANSKPICLERSLGHLNLFILFSTAYIYCPNNVWLSSYFLVICMTPKSNIVTITSWVVNWSSQGSLALEVFVIISKFNAQLSVNSERQKLGYFTWDGFWARTLSLLWTIAPYEFDRIWIEHQ